MKEIKKLFILYQGSLKHVEVPFFRSAIIEYIGREQIHFHNHTRDGSFVYQYPIVQYKSIESNAAIVCIEKSTEAISMLVKPKLRFRIGDRYQEFTAFTVQLTTDYIGFAPQVHYHLSNWQALNQKNFTEWQRSGTSIDRKIQLLERALTGHILGLAEGLNYHIDYKLIPEILEIQREDYIFTKGGKKLILDVIFRTNLQIPEFLSIGKGSSIGYGTLTHIHM